MAIIIRDPVEGVARLIEEQVTKNAIDVNNLKVSDSVLASRISSLEAGANLGGANLVRFSFSTDGDNYYRLMDDIELDELPAGWQNGDYIEVHSSYKNDIPAYGYIDGTTIALDYMGDFVTQYETLRVTNTTRGRTRNVLISRYDAFGGSKLVDINAQNAKSQIVTVLNDISRNLSTQYVSFDLNDDGVWSWVYIGPVGTDGRDGFSIIPFNTVAQYDEILANAKAGDTLLDGAGVVFNKGDLKTILTLQPTVTFSDTGNILGPQGEQGEQGLVGPTTLMSIQAITGITDVAQDSIITIQDTQLNRAAKLGEYLTLIYINTATSNSFMVNAIVTTVGSTDITATVLQAIKITGVQGPQGTAGPAGQSLNIQDGIFIPTTVPVFSTTEEGDAYIVIDTSGQLNTYMLYIHGVGGTDYTVVDNWNGVAGPAPVLTFTSTSTGSGGTSYATVTQTGPGAYTVNLFLASGLNASSVLDNSAGTSITRGYTQAAINQLVQSPNLLINPDLTINQRGESSYSTNLGFGPDRWQIAKSGNAYYDVATKSINCGTTGTYIWLRQKVEIDITTLIGKTLTFSVRLKASTNSFITIGYYRGSTFVPLSANVAGGEDSEFRTITVSTMVPTTVTSTDILTVRAYCNNTNSSIAFEWMKLEVGSIATPFVPPLIAEELPKCQRYGIPIRIHGGASAASSTTGMFSAIPLPTTLRTKPTITVSTQPSVRGKGNTYVVTNITVDNLYDNTVVLAITTSGITANEVYSLHNGMAFLDAEIYN